MSKDLFKDINNMHKKFGFHEVVDKMDSEMLFNLLQFRVSMMREELEELEEGVAEESPEEFIDGIIDLIVFAIGTLDLFDIDGQISWDKVFEANMKKEPGIKEGRPNPFGLPDLIKPEGWQEPNHYHNVSVLLEEALNNE